GHAAGANLAADTGDDHAARTGIAAGSGAAAAAGAALTARRARAAGRAADRTGVDLSAAASRSDIAVAADPTGGRLGDHSADTSRAGAVHATGAGLARSGNQLVVAGRQRDRQRQEQQAHEPGRDGRPEVVAGLLGARKGHRVSSFPLASPGGDWTWITG